MSPRPAPEYGEFATPEEVAEITGRPMPEAAPRAPEGELPWDAAPGATGSTPSAGTSPLASPAADREPERPHPDDVDPASAPPPAARAGVAARGTRPVWDTALALGLLAAGAYQGVAALADPHDFGTSLQASAEQLGWDGSLGGALTDGVGLALAIIGSLLVVVTAAISWLARRRLRRIWWIPASGAVLSVIASFTGGAIIVAAHPGFMEFMTRL